MRLRIFGAALAFASWLAVPAIAGGTIKFGLNTSITGTGAESGQYETSGVKLAIEEINKAGGVLGKQIELVVEDNQTTNPGAVAAFTKLSSQGDIPVIIGPIRSTQVNAILPNINKAGIPVMIGGSDPTLTHQGSQWVFRCRPNDTYSARVMVDFGLNSLKLKKWAIVHSTDTFGTSGMNNLVANLKNAGITPVLIQGYTNKAPDFTPVVLAIKQSGADIIASYFTLSEDIGIFAKQLRQLGVEATWVGSASIISETALKLAGPSLNGSYGVPDFTVEASAESKAYAEKYLKINKVIPDVYSSWAYDAVNVAAKAIADAKSTDPQAIRKAILAINGYKGVEGTYKFDQNGDALRGYNVVKNDGGKIVFIKHVQFDN
jgi:branched-chain amino acid transport system substrate-binding protein